MCIACESRHEATDLKGMERGVRYAFGPRMYRKGDPGKASEQNLPGAMRFMNPEQWGPHCAFRSMCCAQILHTDT